MRGSAETHWCDYCGWSFPWHQCAVVAMTPDEEAEVLAVLESVDETNPATGEWRYCGVDTFVTRDGWTVHVFNDCDEWDYLEEIEAPDGRRWVYPFGVPAGVKAMTRRVADWEPTGRGWGNYDGP